MHVRTDILSKSVTTTGFLVHLETNLTAFHLSPGYFKSTLGHVADVVVAIAVAHYLALTANIELIGHTFLAYIVGVMDSAADGMRTIAADDVRSQLVGFGDFEGLNFYLTDHQAVIDATVGIVIPTYEAADTVLTLQLTCIDTVDQLGTGTTYVTHDTTTTYVAVLGAGNVHV